ncbi:hypothetical protein MACJ_002462 [Theileria orientalis]|uniref:RAP domain-containing protein n=1 Tax=Theileria orientalis TaxID=68886 RepID=A0A976QRD6_THEOR|nr:hypothetical protein MACJ_002462 [Theileria orientalis]
MEMLDLFSLYPSKQEPILVKCKEIKRSTEDNLKLLNYISRGPFNEISRQLFKLVISDAKELGDSDLSVLLADECLLKLPVIWLLEEQLYELNHTGSGEFAKTLLCVKASIVSFIRFFTNDTVTGYSNNHCSVNDSMSPLINKIEAQLSEITDQNLLLNKLLDVIPLETDVPRILVKEFERLLCKEIKETVIHERLKVMLVEDTQSVIFPIYPNDLIQLEANKGGDTCGRKTWETSRSIETHSQPNPPETPRFRLGAGPGFYGIPPCTVPRIPVLIKMYIISKLNYDLIPVCYYGWSKLGDDYEKAKYLDSSHIHLNIEYPEDDAGKLNLNTGENDQKLELKTPVVIISPTPLVDYERLYKKMMKIKPGVSGKKNPENDVIYDEKVVLNDPVYKREMLYKLLRDVESRLAFYRADQNQMEMIMGSNGVIP